jgi:hypothetical protein
MDQVWSMFRNRSRHAPGPYLAKLCAASFAAATSVLIHAGLANDKSECERKTISMLMSPDDFWIVFVHEDTCSGESFATTGITDTIQLVRAGGEVSEQGDIFAVEEHGNPLNRLLTQWLGPRRLQITVPNRSLIGLKKRRYEDVEIIMKYEPDDPAERARFLKELGLPAD